MACFLSQEPRRLDQVAQSGAVTDKFTWTRHLSQEPRLTGSNLRDLKYPLDNTRFELASTFNNL